MNETHPPRGPRPRTHPDVPAHEAVRFPDGFERPEALLETAILCARARSLPPAEVTVAARGDARAIWRVPGPILRTRVEEILLDPGSGFALQWLHDAGVLHEILPELDATVDFSQEAGRRHKDVWEHTKQVVRQAGPRPLLRWAALLHDIGKVPTRTFLPDGTVHFHGHAEVGARMFDDVARRIPFDKESRQQVRFLILHHLRAAQYDASWTDSAVRRFAREMGDRLGDLLDLSRADITSKRPGRRQELVEQIERLAKRIECLREEDARVPPLPTGLGTEIMMRFGLPPSRLIGDLKRELETAIERGEIEPHHDALYYIDHLLKSGRLPGHS